MSSGFQGKAFHCAQFELSRCRNVVSNATARIHRHPWPWVLQTCCSMWWCTVSSHVENRMHECRSAPQTGVYTPPGWNRLEVLFMLSHTSASNSTGNPEWHEVTDTVKDETCSQCTHDGLDPAGSMTCTRCWVATCHEAVVFCAWKMTS